MNIRTTIRIVACHLVLYTFVVFYILCGAHVFYYIEGRNENESHDRQRIDIQVFKQELIRELIILDKENEIEDAIEKYLRNLSLMHVSLETYFTLVNSSMNITKRWTYETSVLFAFTILTTIGYGDIAPSTYECQLFTMIYGAFGIPLFLITIADLGRFFKTFVMQIALSLYKKEFKKTGEEKLLREIGEVLLVALLFLIFIAVGSAILPLWEHDLKYFDSVYLSYMSLTTIGLGDVVPRRMDFLIPTLLYITTGLWLTTALVEQLADVFRLVHYYGRKVSNVKGITVWLGGRRISIGSLIQTVCRRVGMPDRVVGQINWDNTLENVLESHDGVSLFPWHFVDFIEHDPPLIDDFDQMEGEVGSFYCSARFHPLEPSADQLKVRRINSLPKSKSERFNGQN